MSGARFGKHKLRKYVGLSGGTGVLTRFSALSKIMCLVQKECSNPR